MTVFRLALTLILILFSLYAHSDQSVEAEAETSPEAEIIALDDEWIEAEVTGNKSALERILHEDFLATFASGRTINRTAFIDLVLANRPEPFSVTHESIRVHGDTALVIDVSANGKTKYTWIAVKRDQRWRVISETFSRVESTETSR